MALLLYAWLVLRTAEFSGSHPLYPTRPSAVAALRRTIQQPVDGTCGRVRRPQLPGADIKLLRGCAALATKVHAASEVQCHACCRQGGECRSQPVLVLFLRGNVNLQFARYRAVDITVMLKGKDGAGPKLKDFKAYVDSKEVPEITALKHDVEVFAKEFPTIGFEKVRMRGTVRT